VNRTFLFTACALVAFALNSILCRLALRGGEADAAGFTLIRLLSGAAALVLISYFVKERKAAKRGSWTSAFFLFAYAICFSIAYLGMSAGTGALILFGTVQLTMILTAVVRRERPSTVEYLGLLLAFAGLVYLVLPGLAAPPLMSSAFMAAAGIAWGAYTLRGKGSADPLAETTGNFVRSVPMAVIIAVIYFSDLKFTQRGLILAVTSGALASGVGYSIWYAALRHLTSTRAAVLQLLVPVIAASLAVLILNEELTLRLGLSALMVLGGIALTIYGRKR
jgi:drug/metabolite transporter (DMT)-like permease